MSISDIFKSILKFFLNPKIPLSNKAIVFIISIFLLLVIDNIIGFSYYYNNQKQLEQLKSISFLLKDSTLEDITKNKLKELELKTLERKNIFHHITSFVNEFNSEKKSEKKLKSARNNIWFLISSSGLFVISLILLLVFGIIGILSDKKDRVEGLIGIIFISFILFLISWFFYWFLGLIPKIYSNWILNYILNIIIQIGIIILVVFFINKKSNKNNESIKS